jgi:hypothetical protein
MAVLVTAAWIAAAVLMARRGFDVSDEGFYVLSYRWWDSTPRVFTGVQYLYGPVFELLGHSVAGLRLTRLATVVVAHVIFAWAFVGWLCNHTPRIDWSRPRRLACGATIVAAGGITYGWLPLSPGYNDVVALSSLILAGLVLAQLTVARRMGRQAAWPMILAGPCAVAMLLAKWAAAGVTLVFVAVIAMGALRAVGASGWRRSVVALVLSVVASLGVVHLFVVPIDALATQLSAVNSLVAATANSPVELLAFYARKGLGLLGRALIVTTLGLGVAGAGWAMGRRGHARSAAVMSLCAPVVALVVVRPNTFGFPGGGSASLPAYSAVLVGLALIVVVSVMVTSRTDTAQRVPGLAGPRAANGAVLALLALLPIVQAVGTGNALSHLAINLYACWVALMVLAAVVLHSRGAVKAHFLVVSSTACAVVLAGAIGADGLLLHPYRATPYADATVRVGGQGPLAGLLVDDDQARLFAHVQRGAGTVEVPGTPIMAFDEMAGIVLLLDGRSVGEAWYSRVDHVRTRAGIASECRSRLRWTGGGPLIFFDRAPAEADRVALRSCDLDLDRDFTRRPISEPSSGLWIYVPGPSWAGGVA